MRGGLGFGRLRDLFVFSNSLLLLFLCLGWRRRLVRGIVIENARAGVAGVDVAAHLHLVIFLGAKHHIAGGAFLVARLGDCRATGADDAIVMREHAFRHRTAQIFALRVPLGEGLLVFSGESFSFRLFAFNVGGVSFERGFGGFDGFFLRFGAFHQLEDLVFGGADILLGEGDLMHQRFVLLVGLDVERLRFVLGDLFLMRLDVGLEISAGGLVALNGVFGVFDCGFGSGQLGLDLGDALGKGRNLLSQTGDLGVNIL